MSDIKINMSSNEIFDETCLTTIKSLPQWLPGDSPKQMIVPFKFKMSPKQLKKYAKLHKKESEKRKASVY